MCTAISLGKRNLFGRTLDIDCSYNENIIAAPRNYPLDFRHETSLKSHPAIIGIGCVYDGVPLYFDAVNDAGLYAAGLNFQASAVYHPIKKDRRNVASFEFITWVLSNCETLETARELLKNTNITNDSFSPELPTTPLHWIISDKTGSITVESISDGLEIHDNKFGVLTNEPPFMYHVAHLANFMHLSPNAPKNSICPEVEITPYSRGMGTVGLPGDYSSASRFVRAFFVKTHCEAHPESDKINHFFHIMDSVSVPFGCVKNESGTNMYTLYTSCADVDSFEYCFTTYNCRKICSAKVSADFFSSEDLSLSPLDSHEEVIIF